MTLLKPFILLFVIIPAQLFSQIRSKDSINVYKKLSAYIKPPCDSSIKKECNEAIMKATLDLKNKTLRYNFIGLMSMESRAEMYYICTKYNILGNTTGCIVNAEELCYNLFIDQFLEKKYGANFWKRVYKETDSLRKAGKLDRFAFYKGGYKKMEQDFTQMFKKIFPDSPLKKIEIGAKLTIDSIGNVIKIEDSEFFDKQYYSYVETVIKYLKWEPEIRDGQKTSSEITLYEMYNIKRSPGKNTQRK